MPTKKELVTEAENLGIEVKSSMNKVMISDLIDAVKSENKTVVDDVFIDESEPEEIIEEKESEEDLPEEPTEKSGDGDYDSRVDAEPLPECYGKFGKAESCNSDCGILHECIKKTDREKAEREKVESLKEEVDEIPSHKEEVHVIQTRNVRVPRKSRLSGYFPKKSRVLKKYCK